MKILLLDIETAPHLGHVWSLWKQNIGLNQLIEAGYMLCWAAKWHGEKEIYFSSVHSATTKAMLTGIHQLMRQADVIVTYNGIKFDIPVLNKEFIENKFDPPGPSKQVDLYQTVRKRFRFASNRLAYVAESLGLGTKVKHEGHELWKKCMAGNPAAWARMEKYNKQDVVLLERVYNKLMPWVHNHPNRAVTDGLTPEHCTRCGNKKLHRDGYYHTNVNTYQRFRCMKCGACMRAALAERGRKNEPKTLRPV